MGSFGEVFEAFDCELGALVALKRLRRARPEHVARFRREFRSLVELRHDNLPLLFELFSDDEGWFFTMELVSGVPFPEWVRGGSSDAEESDLRTRGGAMLQSGDATWTELEPGESSKGAHGRPVGARDVPSGARCDLLRLRSGMAQLGTVLGALHDEGKLHLDVKPGNVLVRPCGKLTLLDFGLVRDLGESLSGFEGTPHYAAPEQIDHSPLGPETDLYAVGTMLFESLTGILPFPGNRAQTLFDKVNGPAPALPNDATWIPDDLRQLTSSLLSRTCESRPSDLRTCETRGSRGVERQQRPFVGRSAETAIARAWLSDRSRRRIVFVEAPSATGKTAFTAPVARRLGAELPALLVLRGRPSERERVPFNAFEGMGRELALALRDVVLEPPIRKALALVFPAVRADSIEMTEACARGDEAFVDAFRTTLFALAEERPVLLMLDDMQWADDDSQNLLKHLWHHPRSAVISYLVARRADVTPSRLIIPIDGNRLELEPLSRGDSADLACAIDSRLEKDPTRLGALIELAAGSPLFIERLATWSEATLPTTLRAAIAFGVSALSSVAASVLELVCVAGITLSERQLAETLALEPLATAHATRDLERAHWLVRVPTARGAGLAPYHDMVRDTVRGSVTKERVEAYRRGLIRVLGITDPSEASARVEHLAALGEREEAVRSALIAAEHAERVSRSSTSSGKSFRDRTRRQPFAWPSSKCARHSPSRCGSRMKRLPKRAVGAHFIERSARA